MQQVSFLFTLFFGVCVRMCTRLQSDTDPQNFFSSRVTLSDNCTVRVKKKTLGLSLASQREARDRRRNVTREKHISHPALPEYSIFKQ